MATGNDCPSCGENIGIASVFKASMPNRIWCPNCKTRLRYGGTSVLIAVAVVLTLLLVAGSVGVSFALGFDNVLVAAGVAIALLILGGAMLEVAFVLELWYGKYVLELLEKPDPFDADDEF